jgi:hypothetical protein
MIFQDVNGPKADPHRLILPPGGLLLCRIASAATTRAALRLHLKYERKA